VDYLLVDLLHLLLRVGDQVRTSRVCDGSLKDAPQLLKALVRDVVSLGQAVCRKCATDRCSTKYCSCSCHAGSVAALTAAAKDIGVTLQFWASRDEATSTASGTSTPCMHVQL
jgi:hypothetical protein